MVSHWEKKPLFDQAAFGGPRRKKACLTQTFQDSSTPSAGPAKPKAPAYTDTVREQLQKTEETRRQVEEELKRFKDQGNRPATDLAIVPGQSLMDAKSWMLCAAMTRIKGSSESDNLSVQLNGLTHVVQTVDMLKQLRLLSYEEVDHVGNVLEQYRQAALKSDGMQMRQNLTLLDGWLASVQVVDLLPQHPHTSKAKPGSLQEKFS